MSENDTATDNGESNTSEPALIEAEREAPDTLPVTTADPTSVMQSALTSFDGLRVDAAIQVVDKLIMISYT